MKFLKVSKEQYVKSAFGDDISDDVLFSIYKEYEDIIIPKRATSGSAGYDFYSPCSIELKVGQSATIPTGIRVILDEDKALLVFPRSGLGFKYRLQLDNTVGIIDSDYSQSANEGHIFIRITNDGLQGKDVIIKKGQGFAQGVIIQYFKVDDDGSNEKRDGGFGSTTK